jgi:beta-phosphoglucomutase-like phosphatase (HAD superfamily)
LEAAKRLGTDIKNCVVFEDSPSGIKSGVSAGMKVIAIASSQTHETLKGCGASHVVDDFSTINMDFIRGFLKN